MEKNEYKRGSGMNILKSIKATIVPVIVFMAMTPSLLNGVNQAKVYAPELSYMTSPGEFTQVKEQYFKPEIIQYKQDFTMNGKKWTMYWTDEVKKVRKDKNIINSIYFVPEDFKPIYSSSITIENSPPSLFKLIYHNLGDLENKDFASVITNETICEEKGQNTQYVQREFRIPDEIANKLVDLLVGDTELKTTPALSAENIFQEVNHPNMMKAPIYENKYKDIPD